MRMFDTVWVEATCPHCGVKDEFDAQTKDLSKSLYNYTPIPKDWYTNPFNRKFRVTLPCFHSVPYDKEFMVWANQAERREAQAHVPKSFAKLKFIELHLDCISPKCKAYAVRRDKKMQGFWSGLGRPFYGKLAIKKELLIEPLYDITKEVK